MIVDGYDTILFDLDGVLYRGAEGVPGARETVAALRSRRIRIGFVTNNSSRTPAAIAGQLTSLGIEARAEEVETSAVRGSARRSGKPA